MWEEKTNTNVVWSDKYKSGKRRLQQYFHPRLWLALLPCHLSSCLPDNPLMYSTNMQQIQNTIFRNALANTKSQNVSILCRLCTNTTQNKTLHKDPNY